MNNYQSINNLFERLGERYGNHLGIENFKLRIGDFNFKSPQASSYCIQIPLQYIQLIELNCSLILSNRNLFKHIGNYQSESLNQENFRINEDILSLDDFMKHNNLYDSNLKRFPDDDIREGFACCLSLIIIAFIAYHELGHVRQYNSLSRDEIPHIEFESRESNIFIEQAAELDADVFGIHFLYDHLFQIMDNGWDNNPMNLIFKTKKELLHTSIYAILLLFYLSNSDDQIYNDRTKHPHPIVRLDYCMNFIQELCILNEKIGNKKEFSRLMQSVIGDFDSTLSYHFGLGNNNLYYKRFKDPDVNRVKSILVKYIQEDKSLTFNWPYNLAKATDDGSSTKAV